MTVALELIDDGMRNTRGFSREKRAKGWRSKDLKPVYPWRVGSRRGNEQPFSSEGVTFAVVEAKSLMKLPRNARSR